MEKIRSRESDKLEKIKSKGYNYESAKQTPKKEGFSKDGNVSRD